jgi:glycosyltransferase involved in cell wall biosynthesis
MDLSKFENVTVDVKTKRQEIGIPEDAFFLLSVGELSVRKNHQVILKALGRLQNPQIHYAIAGEGDQKERLQALADRLGVASQVHFLGYRKDIVALNMASDAFAFPSQTEGMGLAALEAMACGKPILTSNVHGINDYSIDGVTGYTCGPEDDVGFAKAIETVWSHPDASREMGESNKERVKPYDVFNVIAIMKDIYQS